MSVAGRLVPLDPPGDPLRQATRQRPRDRRPAQLRPARPGWPPRRGRSGSVRRSWPSRSGRLARRGLPGSSVERPLPGRLQGHGRRRPIRPADDRRPTARPVCVGQPGRPVRAVRLRARRSTRGLRGDARSTCRSTEASPISPSGPGGTIPTWTKKTVALLRRALPALSTTIGLPYPRTSTVASRRPSLDRSTGWPASTTRRPGRCGSPTRPDRRSSSSRPLTCGTTERSSPIAGSSRAWRASRRSMPRERLKLTARPPPALAVPRRRRRSSR